MAIIRPSAIVAAISGSVGGVTFVNSRRGLIARHRPAHTASHSASLLERQAVFDTTTRAWRDLTPEQRESWRTLAIDQPTTNRLGLTSPITGFQSYLSSSLLQSSFTGIPLSAPPRRDSLLTLDAVTTNFIVGGLHTVTVESSNSFDPTAVQIMGARTFSTAIPKFFHRFRVVHVQTITITDSHKFQISAGWNAVFGQLVVGEAYAVRVRLLDIADMLKPTPAISQVGIALAP